ncbi:hypothetical protein [Lewinella sp. LCG006]|uniref:hypothetical protein n=1 Tax=Lewinella sp. LCG006 TaxID=3231911 RepID=UPI0034616CF8
MRRKKGFDYGKGKYYLTIVDFPNNVTLHRIEKAAATRAYEHYIAIGKKVEWLGKWDGKKFIEAKAPQASTAA